MSAVFIKRISSLKVIVSEFKIHYHPKICFRRLYQVGSNNHSLAFLMHDKKQPTTKYQLTANQIRYFAKGRDKKKSDKGKSNKVNINEEAMSEVINVEKMKTEMELALQKMMDEYAQNLSLRSNTATIENLKVKYEGKSYLLMEVAQIIRKSPKIIVVDMSSSPLVIPSALKAISSSAINVNPQQDGNTIFVPIPIVTKEHRVNLVKSAKALFIQCKGKIRDVQIKFVKIIKNKEKDGLAEDIGYEVSKQVISFADNYISQAEKIMISKQTELLAEAI